MNASTRNLLWNDLQKRVQEYMRTRNLFIFKHHLAAKSKILKVRNQPRFKVWNFKQCKKGREKKFEWKRCDKR